MKPKWGNGDTRRKHPKDSCIDCHMDIHRVFSNGELYYEYNTVEKLRDELRHRLVQESLADWFEKVEEDNARVASTANAPVSYVEYAECTHLQSKQAFVSSNLAPGFRL